MISIISPVYNQEKYVAKCIESVLEQDYSDFEFILVNDGSTDSTLKILRKYEKQDKRIKIIDKKNEGPGVARNISLKEARGDIVLYLDPDDWLIEGALRKIYDKFQEDDYDLIFFNATYYYHNANLYSKYKFNKEFVDVFKEGAFSPFSASKILFTTNGRSFKAYKRTFLVENDIKYSSTKYVEDSEFFVKAILYAKKMSCIDDSLVNYRLHDESSFYTAHANIQVLEKTFYVCEKIFNDFYEKYPDENLKRGFLQNRVLQIRTHHTRVKLFYRQKYYRMMQSIFRYINKKYGNDFFDSNLEKILFDLVINNNWFMYRLKRFFLSWKNRIYVYTDI